MRTLLDNLVGKRGHKEKVQKNTFLIMASEFVRVKTGNYYDEHLAELLQTLPRIDLNQQEDISGDSIRKKREHLKKVYPVIYANWNNPAQSPSRRAVGVGERRGYLKERKALSPRT